MNNLAIDPLWIWIAVGVVALIIVIALFASAARKSRSERLRAQYGSEYDHAVKRAGNRKRAEAELEARSEEVQRYDIRPLTAAERDRFRSDWRRVEQHFIERPTTAVVEADETVADMMRVQGYPMGDFEKHASALSVKHPRVVEHYRAGHRAMEGAPGSASTEDLRQAMLHYRALFEELLGDTTRDGDAAHDVTRDAPRENEVMTAGRRDVPRDVPVVDEREVNRRP